jgi:3',5'-cyclic-AMP phosphodiesterase
MVKSTAFVTDIHLGEQYINEIGVDSQENWKVILNDISSRKIEKIIFGGDIGALSSYKYFFDSLNTLTKNPSIILGNHDSFQEVTKHYEHSFINGRAELFYCYEENYFKYYFLDSSSSNIGKEQLIWLESELAISKKRKIVFIHHPVLQIQTPIDKEFPLNNREDVKELLIRNKEEIIIFCGHYHMDDTAEDKNIKQYVTPAASYQAVKEAEKLELDAKKFGYRIINFIGNQFNTEIVSFGN